MFIKPDGGLVSRPDQRTLQPNALKLATNVEHRPGEIGLFPTATFVSAGNSTPQNGVSTTAGLIFAHYDTAGGFLICDYGRKLSQGAVATSGFVGTFAQISAVDIEFDTPPSVLSGIMLSERLHVITGQNLSLAGDFDERNLIRQSDSVWRREGLDKPKGTFSSVAAVDVTIVTVPVDTPFTYRAKYISGSSDDSRVENGKLVNDADQSTAAKVWVSGAGNTKKATWDFSNIAETGQATGSQPATGKGILSILMAAGPRAAWQNIGVGGGSSYSLDDDIVLQYSTTGVNGPFTNITKKKGPFISEWFTHDFGATVITLANLAVRTLVTKNSGSLNATAYFGEIRFDVGGGNKAAINTETVDGIHYLISLYSDPASGGSGRESSPGDYGSAILFPVDGTATIYSKVIPIPSSYANGIKQLSFPLPATTELDPAATHFRIYRSPDGTKQKILDRYGLIAQVPIGDTTFTDNFITWPITEVPQPTIEAYFVGQGENVVFYPFNQLPPVAVA